MKAAGPLLLACVVLCIVQSAVNALALLLILALLWGAYFRPRELLGFLLIGTTINVFERHPGVCIAVACVVAVVVLAADRPPPPR